MRNEPTFKQLTAAFVAAGAPGASDRERREAEDLASMPGLVSIAAQRSSVAA